MAETPGTRVNPVELEGCQANWEQLRAAWASASLTPYDDTAVLAELADHESRLDVLETRPEMVKMHQSGAASHTSSNNWQQVPFDTVNLDIGPDSPYADVSADEINITEDGLYYVQGSVTWTTGSAVGTRQAMLVPTGGTPSTGANCIDQDTDVGSTAVGVTNKPSGIWFFNAGDTVQLWAFQNTGGNYAYVVGDGRLTRLEIARISR